MMGAVLAGREALSAVVELARTSAREAPGTPAAVAAVPEDAAGSRAGGGQPIPPARFDRLMDGLNRLPRPLLAFGTLALFGYAMIDPRRFAERMAGLREVPEPMWWILGAVVGFYFGAREAHYFRSRPAPPRPAAAAAPAAAPGVEPNPALEAWRDGLPD